MGTECQMENGTGDRSTVKKNSTFSEIFLEFYSLYLIHISHVNISIKVTLSSNENFFFAQLYYAQHEPKLTDFTNFVHSTKKTTIS